MKKFAFLMLMSMGLFAAGCDNKAADAQKDKIDAQTDAAPRLLFLSPDINHPPKEDT